MRVIIGCVVAFCVLTLAQPQPNLDPYSSISPFGGASMPFGQWPMFPQQPYFPQQPPQARQPEQGSGLAQVFSQAKEMGSWCEERLKQAMAIREKMVNTPSGELTKEGLMTSLNLIEIELSNAAMMSGLLAQVHPDKEMRNASTTCELKSSAGATQLSLDRDLFEKFNTVKDQPATDAVAVRKFEKIMLSFKRSGVSLPSEQDRKRVQSLSDELQELTTTFEQNLNSDTRYVVRDASDTAAVEGIDSEFVQSHTKDGKVTISTDYPDLQPVMKTAASEDLRKELYTTFHQRGYPANLDILSQVLAKRHELATMLNYTNWAEYAMEVLMIENPTHADSFTRDVAQRSLDRMTQEVGEMLELKKADIPDASRIEAYDASYYEEKLRSTTYSVDVHEIRKYFAYNTSRDGVLWLAETLFDVKFHKVTTSLWHPTVDAYDVFWTGKEGSRIGRIYLDMFPRENKYKHAAQFPIRNGVDGIQVPEGALICNFPQTGPMEHGQVTTLFHEFGHLMHHIIGGQEKRFIEFSGVATEWDFVEAPSQMLEEWAFDVDTLQHFAKSQDTGEPIPAELVRRLENADLFGRGIQARQQMFYAQVSLQLHTADPATLDTTQLVTTLQEEFAPYPRVEDTHFQCGFGHLMGYSAIYYTYMWSQALAQHLFKEFTKSERGLLDRSTSIRYRDLVLRQGGTKPARSLVYDFVGVDFSLDALYAYLDKLPVATTTTPTTQ